MCGLWEGLSECKPQGWHPSHSQIGSIRLSRCTLVTSGGQAVYTSAKERMCLHQLQDSGPVCREPPSKELISRMTGGRQCIVIVRIEAPAVSILCSMPVDSHTCQIFFKLGILCQRNARHSQMHFQKKKDKKMMYLVHMIKEMHVFHGSVTSV